MNMEQLSRVGTSEFDNFSVLHVYKTGSSVICNPPVLDTDEDYLVLVDNLEEAGFWFQPHGWTNCFDDWSNKQDSDPGIDVDGYTIELTTGARFQAWRREKENIIVTDDRTLHIQSVAATLLAKELNLTDKAQRIALFRAIKFGEEYTGPLP